MEAIYSMTGIMPEELECPSMPEEIEYLWSYYVELKSSGDVSFLSIKAFSDLMALNLQPNEVATIMDFEKAYKRVL